MSGQKVDLRSGGQRPGFCGITIEELQPLQAGTIKIVINVLSEVGVNVFFREA